MKTRYERNIPAISEQEQSLLAQKHVLVVGCGGLGGYVIEYLARMGIGELTVADGDCFEASNLNRQLLSAPGTLGEAKAAAAEARIRQVNPDVRVHAVNAFLNEDNARELAAGKDLVIDALDNVPARLLLEDVCAELGITLVHGAIQGWSLQAAVIRPKTNLLHQLYGTEGASPSKTSLSFTPPLCAAIEVSEAIRLLCGRRSALEGKLLLADLQLMDWQLIDFPSEP